MDQAETLRKLMSASPSDGETRPLVQFVSVDPGEGRSALMMNLARALSTTQDEKIYVADSRAGQYPASSTKGIETFVSQDFDRFRVIDPQSKWVLVDGGSVTMASPVSNLSPNDLNVLIWDEQASHD